MFLTEYGLNVAFHANLSQSFTGCKVQEVHISIVDNETEQPLTIGEKVYRRVVKTEHYYCAYRCNFTEDHLREETHILLHELVSDIISMKVPTLNGKHILFADIDMLRGMVLNSEKLIKFTSAHAMMFLVDYGNVDLKPKISISISSFHPEIPIPNVSYDDLS